eukprot:jgi/Hompol1/918/HPOL_001052-RA
MLKRIAWLGLNLAPLALLFPLWWWLLGGRALLTDRSDQSVVGASDHRLWFVRLSVAAMQRCGPMYVKFGQWISSRSDLLPPAVCAIFARLQSHVQPHSFDHTRETVEHQLLGGMKLDSVFEWFEHDVIGAGAIAQVHKAKLRNLAEFGEHAGTICAVKVLHPGVEETIQADLAVIKMAAKLISALPGAEHLSILEEVALFGSMIENQMDLTIEANNLDRFAANFEKANIAMEVPCVVRPLVTHRVLVETFVPGILLRKFVEYGPTAFDRSIASIGLQSFMKMVLHDNFAHADLHPGNILVTFNRQSTSTASHKGKPVFPLIRSKSLKNSETLAADILDDLNKLDSPAQWRERIQLLADQGYEPKLVMLDVGLVCQLSPESLDNIRECFKAGIDFDGERIAHLMISRCRDPSRVKDIPGVQRKLTKMMDDVRMNTQGQLLLSHLNAMKIVTRFSDLVRSHCIGLQGDFVGLFVAGIIVEGVGRTLDGDLDLLSALIDYLE